MSENDPHWFALTVRPRHEKAVAKCLSNKGIEAFLPLSKTVRQWSDRVKCVELPLFAGYVFSRFDTRGRSQVITTPGVTSIVGANGTAEPISEEEIVSLRSMVASGLPLATWPRLVAGMPVQITCGVLAGLNGLLMREKDVLRVVVNVELLHRSVAVEIDRKWLQPRLSD